MALNLLTVLPPLNNVQNLLERHANKYGSTIYLKPGDNPSHAGVVPSLTANVVFLSQVAENILLYKSIVNNVKTSFASTNRQNLVYLSIGLIIVTAVVIILAVVVYLSWKDFLLTDDFLFSLETNPPGEDDEVPYFDYLDYYKCFMFICFAVIILFVIYYLYYFMIQKFSNSNFTYGSNSALYRFTDVFETDQVANVVALLNDPAVVAAYNYMNPMKPIAPPASGGGEGDEECPTAGSKKDGQSKANLDWAKNVKYVPGYDGSKLIDPYALKHQLDGYNLFGQIKRLRSAIAYLQTILLKSKDENYKTSALTDKARENINLQIVDVLTTKCALVPFMTSGIGAPPGTAGGPMCPTPGPSATAPSEAPTSPGTGGQMVPSATVCFATALSDNNVNGVVYSGGMSYPLPNTLKVTGTNNKSELIFIKPGARTTLSSASVDFSKFQQIYCADTNTINTIVNGKKPPPVVLQVNDPEKGLAVYTGATLDRFSFPSDNNINVDTKTLILWANSKSILSQLFITLKDWFISAIVDLVIENDHSKKFAFGSVDNTFVTTKIRALVGNADFAVVFGPLTDILNGIPLLLAQRRKEVASKMADKSIFVPVARFKEKVGLFNTEVFISQFVFNCEEIRATAQGISYMNTNFYDGIHKHNSRVNNSIKNTTLFCLIIVVAFAILVYNVKLYFQPEEGVNVQLVFLKEKLDALTGKAPPKNPKLVHFNKKQIDSSPLDPGSKTGTTATGPSATATDPGSPSSTGTDGSFDLDSLAGNMDLVQLVAAKDDIIKLINNIIAAAPKEDTDADANANSANVDAVGSDTNGANASSTNVDADGSDKTTTDSSNNVDGSDKTTDSSKKTDSTDNADGSDKTSNAEHDFSCIWALFKGNDQNVDDWTKSLTECIGSLPKFVMYFDLIVKGAALVIKMNPLVPFFNDAEVVLLKGTNNTWEGGWKTYTQTSISKELDSRSDAFPLIKERGKEILINYLKLLIEIAGLLQADPMSFIDQWKAKVFASENFAKMVIAAGKQLINIVYELDLTKDDAELVEELKGKLDQQAGGTLLLSTAAATGIVPKPKHVLLSAAAASLLKKQKQDIVKNINVINPDEVKEKIDSGEKTKEDSTLVKTAPSGFHQLMAKIEEKNQVKRLENEILRLKVFSGFKVCATVAISIMFLAMIAGYIDKTNVVNAYNDSILTNNEYILVENAIANMTYLYNDIITVDAFKIAGGSSPLVGPIVAGHPHIYVDPWIDVNTDSEPPIKQYFQTIVQNVTLNKDRVIDCSSENSLDFVYSNCLKIVESYNKCNALFSMTSKNYPFPVIEVTVYGVVLLITFIIIGYLAANLQPIKSFQDVRLLNILIEKTERGSRIALEDIPQDLMEWSHEDDLKENNFNSYLILLAGVLLLVFGLIFSVFASKSGASLADVLYSSKLYTNNQCFPPNLQN